MKFQRFVPLLAAFIVVGCKTTPPKPVPEANELAPAKAPVADRNRSLPKLFIVGDSTVHNESPGLVGWGDVIGAYFDPKKIIVDNRARPGRSSRTFQTQGWWKQVLAASRPGDFVLIQLGHNDSSPINDTNRSRGTLPGIGDEKTNLLNHVLGKRETVHAYGWYLRKYISDARAKGMTPIICTSVSRLPQPGKALDTTRYAGWARQVATEENVALIDLNQCALSRWGGMSAGQIKTNYFVPGDNTHFNKAGAELNAECVVEGLRELAKCPLKDFLLKNP